MSWLSRLRSSLGRARESFTAVARLGRTDRPLTPEFWDELEETLLLADFGVPRRRRSSPGCRPSRAKKNGRRPIGRSRVSVKM